LVRCYVHPTPTRTPGHGARAATTTATTATTTKTRRKTPGDGIDAATRGAHDACDHPRDGHRACDQSGDVRDHNGHRRHDDHDHDHARPAEANEVARCLDRSQHGGETQLGTHRDPRRHRRRGCHQT
jgi:hypothetical protein